MSYYDNQNYYDVLGVEKTASFENIERAKDRLKFGDSDDRAPFSMWDKIDEAYAVLSNPESRKEYDKKLEEPEDIYSDSEDYVDEEEFIDTNNLPISDEVLDTEEEKKNLPIDEQEDIVEEENKEEEPIEFEEPEEEIVEQPEEEIVDEVEKEETYENVSEFTSTKNPKSKYVAGAVAGLVLVGPLGAVAIPIIMKKLEKAKLQKNEKKPKKVKKVSTPEMNEKERYNQVLDSEINKLLSEPHNNYKLEINKLKYKNQVRLLENLLEIKMNKKIKKSELLIHKLDLVATKNQLETSKQNLEKVEEKISNYEKEQKLSKMNKELIKVNKEIVEKKSEKPFKLTKLNTYQTKLLNKRNKTATRVKTNVVRSGKFYDGIIKAKDFVISAPYAFKSIEKVEEYLQEEPQRTR